MTKDEIAEAIGTIIDEAHMIGLALQEDGLYDDAFSHFQQLFT